MPLRGGGFFKILGRRLIARRTFVISLSNTFSFELTFTFWEGMRVEIILKLFQSYWCGSERPNKRRDPP